MTNHNHQHHHSHAHGHVHTDNKKVLMFSFIIISLFMLVEIIGGFLANSLALLSDGFHMLSDAISLGVALIAFIYAEKHATKSKTYGYKRFEILAALFNGVTLFIISIIIIIEAIRRFLEPPEVQSKEMFIISVIGLMVNIIVAILMFKGGDTSHNLNMRGAFLHVLGDLFGSVGAIVACHVWTISNDMNALSCHAVVPEYLSVQTCETMLKSIESDLLQLNIQHMTIQLETPEHKHDESTLCSGIHEHSH